MYAAASEKALRSCTFLGTGSFALSVAPGGSGTGDPMPICTGDAAPRLVPGAMAATWLA